MKKAGIFILSILIAVVMASLYGALHDQVTFTILPEYFTVFKFDQFGFQDWGNNNPRATTAWIGILATWWMGLFIGIFQSLVGLMHKDHKLMFRYVSNAILITLGITILFGIFGCIVGYFDYNSHLDCCFPYEIKDKRSFIIVGAIHNYGYTGGQFGALAGIIYQLTKRRKTISD